VLHVTGQGRHGWRTHRVLVRKRDRALLRGMRGGRRGEQGGRGGGLDCGEGCGKRVLRGWRGAESAVCAAAAAGAVDAAVGVRCACAGEPRVGSDGFGICG
jgi:hypothetical protein